MGQTRAPTGADSTAARSAAVAEGHARAITGIAGVTGIAAIVGGPAAAGGAGAASTFMGCLVSCHLGPAPEPQYTVPQRIPVPEAETEDELSEESQQILRDYERRARQRRQQ